MTSLPAQQYFTIRRSTVLNPATLSPAEEDGDECDCEAPTDSEVADVTDVPLDNPDVVVFVSGSSSKN